MSGSVDLSQPMEVTLPLGAWNTVLMLMAKGPWETVDPLMQVMRAQLQPKPPQLRPVQEAG